MGLQQALQQPKQRPRQRQQQLLSNMAPNNNTICPQFPVHLVDNYTQFRPKQFFENGSGHPFLSQIRYMRDEFPDILNVRFLLWDLCAWPNANDNVTNPIQSSSTSSSKISLCCKSLYYHIHKNGGTTLERHMPFVVDNYYSKREKQLGRDEFERQSKQIMKQVHDSQQQQQQQALPSQSSQSPTVITVFTFLRDPVYRFLSSVSQVLKLRQWHTRLGPCTNETSTIQLLECVLMMLETTQTFPEQHLVPQSYELYKFVMGYDIAIHVMDLTNLDWIVSLAQSYHSHRLQQQEQQQDQQLDGDFANFATHFNATSSHHRVSIKRERSTLGSYIRRFPHFRLTKDVLTPNIIRRICRIYRSDVLMLEQTSVTTTICSNLTEPYQEN